LGRDLKEERVPDEKGRGTPTLLKGPSFFHGGKEEGGNPERGKGVSSGKKETTTKFEMVH